MTEKQWDDELAAALTGTDWVINWTTVMHRCSECSADVRDRIGRQSKKVELSPDSFRTPQARKAEILRQLSK